MTGIYNVGIKTFIGGGDRGILGGIGGGESGILGGIGGGESGILGGIGGGVCCGEGGIGRYMIDSPNRVPNWLLSISFPLGLMFSTWYGPFSVTLRGVVFRKSSVLTISANGSLGFGLWSSAVS